MNLPQMDKFCGGPFWDISITWNASSPDFTLCFEKTVLTWIPCIFLGIFSSMELYNFRHTKAFNIPYNMYNITKLLLIVLLELLTLIDIIRYAFLDHNQYPVNIYTPVIKFITFTLFLGLTYGDIKYGIRSSGVLFFFSFLLVVFGAPQYRTLLLLRDDLGMTEFISYMIYFPICVAIFILNCFADARPLRVNYPIDKNVCPEYYSAFLSKLLFSWFDTFAWKGYRKPLVDDDLWTLDYVNKSCSIVPVFEKYWQTELKGAKNIPNIEVKMKPETNHLLPNGDGEPIGITYKKIEQTKMASIFRPLLKTFGMSFLFATMLKLFQDLLTFVNPLVLSLLIAFVQNKENPEPMWRGYMYAVLLFLVAIIQSIMIAQYFHRSFQIGLRIRTALIALIYKKALTISNNARKNFTMGEIVNLMAVDAQRFVELMGFINMLWSAPLQIIIAIFLLWQRLGPSVLAGLAVMVLLIPVNGVILARIKSLQMKQMKNKDDRVKLMNEILSGIKVLKLYAWEPSFENQVVKIRNKEISVLKSQAYLNAGISFLWACAPFLVSLATFAVYILSDKTHVLDADTAFVSLALFNILRFPLTMLPMLISNLVQTTVSMKRINKFLNSEDLDPNAVSHEDRKEAIHMEDGNFSWDGHDKSPFLKNINIDIQPGSLIAIVGPVGCGKSSLLSAFLGEMYKQSGYVNTRGSIAYVPQQAWIQNATFKDNITFGDKSNHVFYDKVLEACALKPDLTVLPAGDQTEIGEKGINLSGGQKQRISLARSVFFGADIYLLDDPLSAVDSHVGKHIFEEVVGPTGLLKNKTRILVTNALTYLPQVDHIIVLKDGSITDSGSFNELLQKKGDFADFLITYFQEGSDMMNLQNIDQLKEMLVEPEALARQLSNGSINGSIQSLNRQRSVSESGRHRSVSESGSFKVIPNKKEIIGEKLIEIEKAETGNVKLRVYLYYLAAVGPFLVISTLVMNFLFQGFSVGSNVWLSIWSSDSATMLNGTNVQNVELNHMYLGVYGILGIAQAISVLLSSVSLYLGSLKATNFLHNELLGKVFRWALGTFDITPIGRILNRFSYDVEVLDNVLPRNQQQCIGTILGVISTIFINSYSTPPFLIIIVPVFGIYYFVQRFYVSTSRQLKRLESISRSPIYSHFGESVAGAQSIRAYGLKQKFIKESEDKVDFNQRSYYPNLVSNRWLSVRLETVGNMIIFFAALFAVLGRDTLSAGIVGLSVSYALTITQTLNWLVRMTSEVETNIVAVERIKEYGEVPKEADWEVANEEVPEKWPSKGEITFDNFQVRYREGLDLVLKGISFHVNENEKVGIVGRTGAGKSSLTLSLFRIIEPAGGKILIDGVDVSKLGLHTLRSRLTIIPQDPVLFSGTLRINLDPTEEHSDENIWRALEFAHLKNHISSLEHGLQHEISEGGDNFSVGQRQLICLARALLRKTKVLVLDEATAAIDLETDDLIQSTIRSEFKNCTVMTIAHRLNTIMDYDRIIVLDQGNVVEFNSPASLLKSKSSVFYGMAVDAGLV